MSFDGQSRDIRFDHAVLIAEGAFLCPLHKDVVIRCIAWSCFHPVESLSDKDIVKPLVILGGAGFASGSYCSMRPVILGTAFDVWIVLVPAIDKQIVREHRSLGVTSGWLSDEDVVIDKNGAVVHLQENGGGFGVVDDIAGNPDALVAEVNPNAKSTLRLSIDSPDQVAADDGIHAIVKLDRSSLPAAELPAVIGRFNEIAEDQ